MKNKLMIGAVVLCSMILSSCGSSFAEESDPAKLSDAAQVCLHAGNFDKAIELFEKALAKAQDPKLKAKIFLGLCSSYLEKGIEPFISRHDDSFYKKSLQYANEYLKIVPNQWQAIGNIGTVYMNMGDYEKADAYYKEAIKYADRKSVFYKQLLDQHDMILKEIEHAKRGHK